MLASTDDPNFKRDDKSNAVLNTNVQAYQEYKLRRDSVKKMENMEKELDELKSMVKALLESRNG
jgi:hypothetical protein